MRKVNVLEFVSLDGVIQAPGGPEEDQWRLCVWRVDRRVAYTTRFPLCGEFESFPAYVAARIPFHLPLKPKSGLNGPPASSPIFRRE